MQLRLLFNAFLICSSTMYAMELTTTNYSNGIPLTDDLLVNKICPQLDRPTRNILRCTCTKYLNLVFSQDELDKNYRNSFFIDREKISYWKNLGALEPHEEFANAVKNEKKCLAAWLLEKKKVQIWDAYCSNILEAVKTSTVDEMLPVIEWLLYSRQPVTYHNEFLSGYHFTNNLKEFYPEAKKIIDLFKKYEERRKI